ncbi:tetratricopeptide repeat protein [Gloeothece verrucosa]|uniref:tetratricopeptide repeat protein n=1 Tax=Gloeothece verrucosa TaxID=2546359 RepID=UPI000303BE79|nr:hypothetical protein [Gloeothece verrucosa]
MTLIALSYGKERIINPVSVATVSQKNHQTESLKNSIAQEEKIDSDISNIVRKALELGYYHYARQQIKLVEDLPLQVQLLRELTDAYLAVGQTEEAYSIVNQAVTLDKESGSFDPLTWCKDWLLTGQEERVKDLIQNLDKTSEQAAQIRLSLAQSYFQVGNIAKAFQLVQLIPVDTVFVPDDYPNPINELLQGIIDQALQENNKDLAAQVALSFPGKIEQVIALRKIAHQYFQEKNWTKGKEKLSQALTIAKTIDAIPVIQDRHSFWSEPNANLLLQLAQDYYELGERQKALEILALAQESIQNFKTQFTFDVVVWNRSKALQELAAYYLNFGENRQALAILDLATEEAKKFRRKREVLIQELLTIATTYVQIGQKNKAELLWQDAFYKLEIIDPKSAELVLKTARVAILVGHKEEGIKLVEQTQSFLMQLEIAALAEEEKSMEKLAEKKLQEINQLPFNDDKIISLEQVALSLAENPKIALKFSGKIKNPLDQAYLLVAIAKNYAQKNNWNIANNLLKQAVAAAETIPEQQQREEWFIETTNRLIAINQVDEHLVDEAQGTIPLWQLQVAQKIVEKSNLSTLRAKVNLKLLQTKMMDNNEESALNSLKKNLKYFQKASLKKEFNKEFLNLFKLAIKSNKNDVALFLAENIFDKDYKIVALRQAAQKYAVNGNKEKAKKILSEVMKIAQTINDSSRNQELIKGITEQQEKIAGQRQQRT